MATIGVGIIGLGVGRDHLTGYLKHPDVEVRGVCDINLERARDVAASHHIAFVTADYRELLAREDIQLVSVTSPDNYHAEQVIAAAQAGKHILCEKPMALSLSDCERMITAADAAGVQLMVGQVCRYAPGFVLAKRLIERGDIGELFFVESEYAHDYTHIGGWRKDPALKREPFLGGACHAVDLVRWVAGEITEVFAYANHKALPDWPVDDCTIAVFKFANGCIGKVLGSIGCKRPYTMRSVFYGTLGTIICDNSSPHIEMSTNTLPVSHDWIKLPVNVASHNIAAEISELIEAIRANRPVCTDGREGAKTVAACLAAVQSAASGQPVGLGVGSVK